MAHKVEKIAVIGSGNMGRQIALNAAIQGFTVRSTDSLPVMQEQMRTFKEEYLAGRVAKGRLTQEQADAAAARLTVVPSMEEAVEDADLVIEAVVEVLDVKKRVFAELDALCPEKTILATNSSYICSSELAAATNRPDRVCNMHYFSPALVMKLVEIVRNPQTSQETIDAVYETCERLNKVPVVVEREIPGFIVNRLLDPYMREAQRLADMGIASIEDIDKAARYGLGYPMGPFELNDMTGLDLSYTIFSERYRKSGNPEDLPSMILSKHYLAGEYGRKTGKGFYDYTKKKEQ